MVFTRGNETVYMRLTLSQWARPRFFSHFTRRGRAQLNA